jgi:NADH-quinone oxidoreductase subunit L
MLSVIGGWLQFAPVWHPVETWLETVAEPLVSPTNWQEAVSSILAVGLGAAGIGVAWLLYGVKQPTALSYTRRFRRAAVVFEHKFYFDELYDTVFYRPSAWTARAFGRLIEQPLIAGSGRELGDDTRDLGGVLARLQTGLLRTYALAIASALAVLAVVFVAVK